MHRCLTISEVLSVIFEATLNNYEGERAYLAGLARTCKIFFEPAIHLLWRKQEGLQPLLECLPQELWEYDPNMYYDMCICLDDPGVTDLGANDKMVTAEVLYTLHKLRPLRLLLPNLLSLTCGAMSDSDGVPLVALFIHSRLKSLRISFDFRSPCADVLSRIIRRTRESCPSLESFTLLLERWAVSGLVLTCEIEDLQNLRVVEIRTYSSLVSQLFIQCLASLPLLEEVTLRAEPQIFFTLPAVMPCSSHEGRARAPFPSLRRLTVTVEASDAWAELAQLIRWCSSLSSVNLELDLPESESGGLENITTTVSMFTHLTSLAISTDLSKSVTLSDNSLRTLFALKHLQDLEISSLNCPDLNEALLRELLIAWPNMRSLSLPGGLKDFESMNHGSLTRACFEVVARYGVNLNALAIAVKASEYDFYESRPVLDEEGKPLQNLTLSNLTLNNNTSWLWDSLLEMFPNIGDSCNFGDSWLLKDLDLTWSEEA
ncbi:hypothetical protein NEOLEDRAFT_1166909 [Neolentinus lepideus HHB14362 ss-1]|uniref:F-box domain-containing protein n=1 Tax=Neolentinus lepideus HHB14362 ss-1 TaxID=1314782 RepID=A0A165VAU9_9AGAM|nr:hypothetical protein NEOLEDRAFT_1166909 [Neolentinus lepideus HHB14362 ss-1]